MTCVCVYVYLNVLKNYERMDMCVRAPYPLYFRGRISSFPQCKLVIRGYVCGLYSSFSYSNKHFYTQTVICIEFCFHCNNFLIGIHSFLLAYVSWLWLFNKIVCNKCYCNWFVYFFLKARHITLNAIKLNLLNWIITLELFNTASILPLNLQRISIKRQWNFMDSIHGI